MPPRLTARAMFWWGVGLLAFAVVGTELLTRVLRGLARTATGPDFLLDWWVTPLSTLGNLAYFLGAALVAISFAVRALGPREVEGRPEWDEEEV